MRYSRHSHVAEFRKLFVVGVSLLLSACASIPQGQLETPLAVQSADGQGQVQWWRVRFTLEWPEEQYPDFSLHALIADRIISGVIAEHNEAIELWRFHRRAARDNAGHQFSFIYHADPLTAQQISTHIERHNLVRDLRKSGHLLAVKFSKANPSQVPVAATSDPDWPTEISRTWPWFIMGISQSWMELVREVKSGSAVQGESMEGLLVHYQQVEKEVTRLWQSEGYHAYLHHLNALFGYAPVFNPVTESYQQF